MCEWGIRWFVEGKMMEKNFLMVMGMFRIKVYKLKKVFVCCSVLVVFVFKVDIDIVGEVLIFLFKFIRNVVFF